MDSSDPALRPAATSPARGHPTSPSIAPLQPIGIFQGHVLFRDASGIAIAMPVNSLTRAGIARLFATTPDALRRLWPPERGALPAGCRRDGWDHLEGAADIIRACSLCGLVDPARHGFKVTYRWPRSGGCQVTLRPIVD
jgi:hypothetical protein